MDVRVLLTALVTVLIVVLCHADSDVDHAIQVIGQLYPVYTIKQTSSNHGANIQQMHSKYTCTTCALIARCLLDVCLIV